MPLSSFADALSTPICSGRSNLLKSFSANSQRYTSPTAASSRSEASVPDSVSAKRCGCGQDDKNVTRLPKNTGPDVDTHFPDVPRRDSRRPISADRYSMLGHILLDLFVCPASSIFTAGSSPIIRPPVRTSAATSSMPIRSATESATAFESPVVIATRMPGR